jgi:Zn-dependent peptidase ImmA (M78 family)
MVLPTVNEPSGWRDPSVLEAVADHLIAGMTLDVALADLHDDLVGALRESQMVHLRWAERVAGTCDLHGSYDRLTATIRLELGKPPARTNFTAAHELGHHLQANDLEWGLEVLAELRRQHPTIARFVEEELANVTAARLLIPAAHVQLVWNGSLTPGTIEGLRRDGRVSHHAAIIRAATLTSDPAIIVVVDATGTVIASRSTADSLFQAPGGSMQPDLRDLFEGGKARTGVLARSGIVYTTGNARADLTYDVGFDSDATHLIAIARPVYTFGSPQWAPEELECSFVACGWVFTLTAETTCPRCRTPKCPSCGTCDECPVARGAVCRNCFLEMSIEESLRATVHDEC